VLDPSGKAIAGVRIDHVALAFSTFSESNLEGRFRFNTRAPAIVF
jgi:hypothetical protein